MIQAYPLNWPVGYKKTEKYSRTFSAFKQTPEKAQKYLRDELAKLGTSDIVISTNIPTRKDGYFYADMALSKIEDPGVAVYFKYKKKNISMCADKYETVTENLYAIGKSINAIRSMERWGVSDFIERTFSGFKEIGQESSFNFWDILNMKPSKDKELIKMQYKAKAFGAHPDHGGSTESFHQLQSAFEQAMQFANS